MKCPPDLKIIQKKVKSKNTNFFCLEESCATQQPYQNNQGTLWWSDDLTENPGLRYFLYSMKKIRKPNESENRQIAFTCQLQKSRRTKTRQSIKLANMCVMHALGRSVAIVYQCGCVLASHVSIMYALQICLIGTNLKVLAVFSYLLSVIL